MKYLARYFIISFSYEMGTSVSIEERDYRISGVQSGIFINVGLIFVIGLIIFSAIRNTRITRSTTNTRSATNTRDTRSKVEHVSYNDWDHPHVHPSQIYGYKGSYYGRK